MPSAMVLKIFSLGGSSMNDIVDYSRKLKEESKKQKKIWIIVCVAIAFFAFSIGFYASYAFNSNNRQNNYKSKFDTIYSILKDEWYYGIDEENIERQLIDRAIYGMLDEEKDPFTRYLTSLGSLASTYEGLGITVSEYKEYFVINEVSSQVNIDAGFKQGDVLKEIDGNSLAGKDSEYIKTLISGKKEVDVLIERKGVEMSLRGYVTTYSPVTVFKDFSYSEDMAYIKITEFAENTSVELDKYLSEAKAQNYVSLILDLRGNPGGYIYSVTDCADLFLEKGKVVLTTKDKNGNSYSYKTSSNSKYDFTEIVILIDNNSASGAEALSAALNENLNEVVELVGVTTYGKGSAQKMVQFTDGTYFNYTYALWYTPSGKTIHKQGVAPERVYTGSGIHLINFSKNELEKNDYGIDVYNLQLIMKNLGYYSGELTSFYDEMLEQSLKEFQEDEGIFQTGKLDKLTIRYILAIYYEDKVADSYNELMDVLGSYSA